MAAVSERVVAELGVEARKLTNEADADVVRERIAASLAAPLTEEAAVQIALLNNRGLQARYNALGLSEAQVCSGQPAGQPDAWLHALERRRHGRDGDARLR